MSLSVRIFFHRQPLAVAASLLHHELGEWIFWPRRLLAVAASTSLFLLHLCNCPCCSSSFLATTVILFATHPREV
ncbi:hypothetical protein KC19_6G196600 [Ceratodon purpureus]|uniref:Uncharacterized protein n=1 Tax=Ceratodon purpureus TaxID=3225 RepID=A0A8T0HJD9_CERPU|nr:hypothetical protein KC19_6G196600 [Ceratodon purpureus]